MLKKYFLLIIVSCVGLCGFTQKNVAPGAANMKEYLPLLKGKTVGFFANQTSMIANKNGKNLFLIDSLLKLGVNIQVIFGPEHGFRGEADAGEKVGNYVDEKTGIPVISLYGPKRRPSAEDLKNIDVLLFDIQDVGVRFYTFISSLQEYMEAAFENDKPLIILDRPNPNGYYVDGPVLNLKYKSFVGMQPVPIVYGMTIGEYASMLVGEKWLKKEANEKYDLYKKRSQSNHQIPPLTIIKNSHYNHNLKLPLSVKPSPNLPDLQSIFLYLSTCFFEGTTLSEGRGTDKPFQTFGAPSLPKNLYSFTPKPNSGAKNSKHFGEICYGWNLSGTVKEVLKEVDGKIQLKWLLNAYQLFPDKDNFFILPKSGNMEQSFFNKLAGNNGLWQQIKEGKSEEEIRKSWEPELSNFKKIRKKYLLYPDFNQ